MSSKAMSLKAKIRNLAHEKHIAAQVLLQNYMFERLLERLSLSEYKDKFVLKGGMLVAAIVGADLRSTMDMDATIRRFALTENSILQAMTTICSVAVNDDTIFQVGNVSLIRPDDEYGGYRVTLTAVYDTIATPLSVDITTGDVITPQPVKYTFQGIFEEEKQIEVWAYNIETVMAEKVETILRRNVFNTRPRDFYDIYILSTTQVYDKKLLWEAVAATAEHRNTTKDIADTEKLLALINESRDLQQMWEKYRRQFPYAKDITYEQIMEALWSVCNGNFAL